MKNLRFLLVALFAAAAFAVAGPVGGAVVGVVTAATSPVLNLDTYSGKYKDELFSTLLNGLDVAMDVHVETLVKSKLTFTKLGVSDGARPHSDTEQIEGDELNYTGIVLEVLEGKRELSVSLKKYQSSWLANKMRGSHADKSAADMPFPQYTWDQIIKSLQAELNNKTAYFGFDKTTAVAFDSGDTYTAGDYITYTQGGISSYFKALASTSAGEDPDDTPAKWQKVNAEAICPGFGTHLAALITAGSVTVTTTGVIDNSSNYAYASLKKIWRDVDEAYKNKGVKCYLSRNIYELFVEDYEDKVGKYTLADGSTRRTLPGSDGKCEFVVASWMAGSNRVIMTPKENMVMGTDLLSDMNTIEVVKSSLWVAKMGISFVLGFKFRDPAAVWCNDVA